MTVEQDAQASNENRLPLQKNVSGSQSSVTNTSRRVEKEA
jgi:hypothetical protein